MADHDTGDQPTLTRIDRNTSTLGTEVYDTLLSALMEGRIQPGDRLVMDRIAAELDVSRTPIRDALQRLHRDGIIEPAGRRGYLVREPSARDTNDFYEARMAVEGYAAARLVQQDHETLDGLRSLLAEIADRPRGTTWESFDMNRQFHRGVVVATGNSYLIDMFDTIWNRSQTAMTYRQFAAANPYPYQDFVCEHEKLIHDLDGADPESARRSMVDHIRSGLERTKH
jgi:DNA-binding GntR family transcriptional regulator